MENLKIKHILLIIILTFSLSASVFLGAYEGETEMKDYLLLDDLKEDRSTLDTEWEGFTDQVMGGVSEMTISRVKKADGNYIKMRGRVSLENRGGFIQIRLKLTKSFKPFDGSSYRGIRLLARGVGSGYYIFLRTTATIFPWKYYAAPVPVSDEWQIIDIPWASFEPGDYGSLRKFRPDKLKSIALVAYGKEFNADIELKEIGLY